MNRQEELEAMSDYDINVLVLDALGVNSYGREKQKRRESEVRYFETSLESFSFDYCNNPSDIIPIAIENNIGYTWAGLSWAARAYNTNIRSYSEGTPYRAICIVLVLIRNNKDD